MIKHYTKIFFYIARFFLVGVATIYILENILRFLLENPDNLLGVVAGLIGNVFGVFVLYWMYKQVRKAWKYIQEPDKESLHGK